MSRSIFKIVDLHFSPFMQSDSFPDRLERFRTSRKVCNSLVESFKTCLQKRVACKTRGTSSYRKMLDPPDCGLKMLEQNLCIGSYICPEEHRDTMEEVTPDNQRALATCIQNYYLDIKRDFAENKANQ